MEIKTTRYHKPELDAYVEQQCKEIKQLIAITAPAFAAQSEPPLSSEDLGSYFLEHHLLYQGLIHAANEALQTNNLVLNASSHDKQTATDIAALQNELIAAKEDRLIKEKSLEGAKPPYSKKRFYLAWAVVGLLSLFEGLVNRPSFTAYGYNLAEAFIMSIAFAALLAVYAHSFWRITQKGKTVRQKRIIAIMLLGLLTAVFAYLAVVRAEYLSTQAATETGTVIHFSAIPFTLLSLLLFIASVLVCHFFLPTREQRSAMKEYQKLEHATRNGLADIQRIEQAIKAQEKENEELNKVHNSLQEYGSVLEQRIITYAHHGLALWKKLNLLNRKDGRPKSFDSTEYPLQFKTYFHHVTLL